MKVYLPLPEDGYELVQPIHRHDFETIATEINGQARLGNWVPIKMELIREDEHGKPLVATDTPWHGSHALMFKDKAVRVLMEKINTPGELLDLDCGNTKLYVLNPRVIDVFDERASIVNRLKSGRIFRVDKYSFRCDELGNVDFFKIPNLRVSPTFCLERVVGLWRSSGIKGVVFQEVFSS